MQSSFDVHPDAVARISMLTQIVNQSAKPDPVSPDVPASRTTMGNQPCENQDVHDGKKRTAA